MSSPISHYFRLKPEYGIFQMSCWTMLCLLAFSGCGKNPAAPERPPVSVTIAPAQAQNVPLYIDEIGNCLALQSVSIVPQVSGAVTNIHFQDGADVKTGDLLYTIDPRTYQAARDKAAATLAADQATLKLNRAQLDRSQNLVEGNFISPQDLENLKTVVATSEATVKQDKALLDTAEINLAYCTIRSPIDGKTGVHLVDIGNVVTAYSNGSLVSIQRNNPLYVDFIVTESDLPRVRQYFINGSLKVEVYFPDDETKHRTSDLFFLDNAVQTGSGTVKLRAILPNEDRLFWPGQFVKVKLILAQIPNAIVVPYSAVQIGHDGPFVFIAKSDNTVELRAIKPGQRQGDNIVIDKGVAANEMVVLTGQLLLSPGAKIVTAASGTPASDEADKAKLH